MFKIFILSLALFTQLSLFADSSQGETLERQLWDNIKDQKWTDLGNKIAPYFQGALFEGGRNKEQYMTNVKNANIHEFNLKNFVVTEGPGTIVITYDVAVTESIEGKSLTSDAVRLSVWQNDHGKWQLIAHAALIPVPEKK